MAAEDETRRQHRETREMIARAERRIHACIVSTIATAALALAGLMLALTSVLMGAG